MKKLIFSILFVAAIQLHGQVGINTTNPTATLHVVGTTVPGVTGGTTTLYSNDFTSGSITSIQGTSNTCVAVPNIWAISATSVLSSCTTCTGNRAYIGGNISCNQNQMFKTSNFTPTTTLISIGFNYSYDDASGTDDSFLVTLYNETTATVVGTLITLGGAGNSQALDATLAPVTQAVVAGNSYSLRFTYTGINDNGAAVDNILVTQNTIAVTGAYTFRLQDGTQADGKVLTSDASGNAYWKTPISGGTDSQTISISGNNISISNGNTITLPSAGGNTYTNGLTQTGAVVRLGGTLTQATALNLDTFNLTFGSNTAAVFPGEIVIQGKDRIMMNTKFEKNFINFGGNQLIDLDDGTSFLDSGSASYTKDFVAGFDNGNLGGTAFSTGSIEYIVDGTNELFLEASGFSPMIDETTSFGNTLGKSNRRWGAVYATNGVITTSDMNLKTNVKPLSYGLNEILKLNTITYNWKNYKLGKTIIPIEKQERKIGFSAQQLLEILPEVVQTHSWVPANENGDYKEIRNENLGVMYSDIIPVAVKAIQEQQAQIEDLKKEIAELKELIKAKK